MELTDDFFHLQVSFPSDRIFPGDAAGAGNLLALLAKLVHWWNPGWNPSNSFISASRFFFFLASKATSFLISRPVKGPHKTVFFLSSITAKMILRILCRVSKPTTTVLLPAVVTSSSSWRRWWRAGSSNRHNKEREKIRFLATLVSELLLLASELVGEFFERVERRKRSEEDPSSIIYPQNNKIKDLCTAAGFAGANFTCFQSSAAGLQGAGVRVGGGHMYVFRNFKAIGKGQT